MCHTDDVSSGRSSDRHQASWELCGKEGRTNDAYHFEGKFASRFTHRHVLEIYGNRCQITPKWLPFRSPVRPGVLQGLEDHPNAPKRTLKGIPRRPKGALWEAHGRPKSDQESPKSVQREPKSAPGTGRPRERQNREKVGHRGAKKSISAKVLRDSPLPMRGALWTPSNRSKIKPECSKMGS